MCKILLWLYEHMLNQKTPNFYQISNLIKIPLVGRTPGLDDTEAIWENDQVGSYMSYKWMNENLGRMTRGVKGGLGWGVGDESGISKTLMGS